MSFSIWAQVGRRRHVLGGVHASTTWRIPMNCPCVAVMWPVVKLLWPLVVIVFSLSDYRLFMSLSNVCFCVILICLHVHCSSFYDPYNAQLFTLTSVCRNKFTSPELKSLIIIDQSSALAEICWDWRPCQSKVGRKVGAAMRLLGPHIIQC